MQINLALYKVMAVRKRSCATVGVVTDAPDEDVKRFGVLTGDDFLPLSNFQIDLIQEVKAGCESGFLCSVKIHQPVECSAQPYSG